MVHERLESNGDWKSDIVGSDVEALDRQRDAYDLDA